MNLNSSININKNIKTSIYRNCEKLEFSLWEKKAKKNILNSQTCEQAKSFDKFSDELTNKSDDLVRSFALFLQMQKKTFLLERTLGSDFLTRLKKIEPQNFERDLFWLLQELASFFPDLKINSSQFSVKCLQSHQELNELEESDELDEFEEDEFENHSNSKLNLNLILISISISVKKNNNKYLIVLEVPI